MDDSKRSDAAEKRDYTIDSRVILFAFGVLLLFTLGACTTLMVFYHSASSRYHEQVGINQRQAQTHTTLQRSLDRADGKLQVYEAYLVNRNIDIVRNLIARFVKDERKDPAKATLKQFEVWLGIGCALCPSHEGVGSGGR